MAYCCDLMKQHHDELQDRAAGVLAIGGEPLRFCPWCGAPLAFDSGLAAATAAPGKAVTAAASKAPAKTASAKTTALKPTATTAPAVAARKPAAPTGELAAYVDGACSNNQAAGPQRGGWAAVFTDGRTFSGGDRATTNNRMELKAAIEALKQAPAGSAITIYSDSAYVVNAFLQNWFRGWDARGWRNVKGEPVENQDLWRELRKEAEQHRVKWVKVKGHAGNEFNEVADQLAVAAIPRD